MTNQSSPGEAGERGGAEADDGVVTQIQHRQGHEACDEMKSNFDFDDFSIHVILLEGLALSTLSLFLIEIEISQRKSNARSPDLMGARHLCILTSKQHQSR